MVRLTSDDAKKNSSILIQRAMQRRDTFCSTSITNSRQTTKRIVPRNPEFASSAPKIEVERPKICKPSK